MEHLKYASGQAGRRGGNGEERIKYMGIESQGTVFLMTFCIHNGPHVMLAQLFKLGKYLS